MTAWIPRVDAPLYSHARQATHPAGRFPARQLPPAQKAVQDSRHLLRLQAPTRISPLMNRRHFLASSLGLVAASPLAAIGPIQRAGQSRMQLGVAAYSFREAFQWSRGKEQKVEIKSGSGLSEDEVERMREAKSEAHAIPERLAAALAALAPRAAAKEARDDG